MTENDREVLEMAAEDSGQQQTAAESSLGQLSELAVLLKSAKADVEHKQAELAEAVAVVTQLEQKQIPELMRELRAVKYTMDDGSVLTLKPEISVSIPVDHREAAYDWAEKNGHGGIVKTEISVAFGKGEYEDAKELYAKMATVTNRPVEMGRSIHPSTLKAFVKEAVGEVQRAKERHLSVPEHFVLPEEMFSIFEYFKVGIKEGKK